MEAKKRFPKYRSCPALKYSALYSSVVLQIFLEAVRQRMSTMPYSYLLKQNVGSEDPQVSFQF